MRWQPSQSRGRAGGPRPQETGRAPRHRGGLARATAVATEHGARAVQPDELVRLAELYGRPVHELLRQREPLVDLAVQFCSSHAQQGLDAPEAASAIEELQRLSEDHIELARPRRAG